MTAKCLKYKSYMGSIDFSLEDGILYGKIECIDDLVTYEAETLAELQKVFEESVEDYIETCASIGKEPDKTMSGTFNVRVGAELHRKLYVKAREQGTTLNDFVKETLETGLSGSKQVHHVIFSQMSTNVSKSFHLNQPSGWEGSLNRAPTRFKLRDLQVSEH